jgi:hypothetical protein
VDEAAHRQLARNEALFRRVNEAIERGQFPGEPDKLVRFRCECAQLECNQALEVSLGDYERVRENPRRFLVAFDHVEPEVEDVVERSARFMVVEKRSRAGEEVAEATDQRT